MTRTDRVSAWALAACVFAFLEIFAQLGELHGQTRPRSEQILNAQQVRIGAVDAGDTRPGTHVPTTQITMRRWICRPTWLTDPAENGQPTICTDHYYGITIAPGPLRVVESALAYTAIGRDALFVKDPEMLVWWNMHKDDLGPRVDPAGVDMMRKLLTSPAIVRPSP